MNNLKYYDEMYFKGAKINFIFSEFCRERIPAACLERDEKSGIYTLYTCRGGRPLASGDASKVRGYMVRSLTVDPLKNKNIEKLFTEYRDAVDAAKKGTLPRRIRTSNGNSKTGTPSISFPPFLTCFHGGKLPPCARYCYAVKNARFQNVRKNDVENLILYKFKRPEFWWQLSAAVRDVPFFRVNVDADIPDADFFRGLLSMQAENLEKYGKTARIWLYTKRSGIVNQYCKKTVNNPESLLKKYNISVLFSAAAEIVPDNPYNFPTFDIGITEKERHAMQARGLHECAGDCTACIKSGRGCPFGESSFTMIH